MSVNGPGPASSGEQLWNTMQGQIRDTSHGTWTGDDGTALTNHPLTDVEYAQAVKSALTSGGGIDAQEQAILNLLSNPQEVNQVAASPSTPFNADALKLVPQSANGASIQSRVEGSVGIRAQRYDVGRMGAVPSGSPQTLFEMVKNKEVRLGNDAELTATLTNFGQLALPNGKEGKTACGAASLTALAMASGKKGLTALCQAILADAPHNQNALQLSNQLRSNVPPKMESVLRLANDLFVQWDRLEHTQNPNDPSGARIFNATIEGFITNHKDVLAPLFTEGRQIINIDGNGDLRGEHFVVVLPQADGSTHVYDPWERGHVNDQNKVERWGHVATGDQAQAYLKAKASEIRPPATD